MPQRIYLYPASDAMDLRFEGLAVEPAYFEEGDFDWEKILGLICPR
jgi:hypothetical protein